jgi:hypothetical protein
MALHAISNTNNIYDENNLDDKYVGWIVGAILNDLYSKAIKIRITKKEHYDTMKNKESSTQPST